MVDADPSSIVGRSSCVRVVDDVAHIVIALALRVFTAAITVVDSPTIRSVSPDPYLGKAVAVWGEGASYTGPGGVWLNREP